MLFPHTQRNNHALKKHDNQPQSIQFTKKKLQWIHQFTKIKIHNNQPILI